MLPETFQAFEDAVSEARSNRNDENATKKVGETFKAVLQASGKINKDIAKAKIADRTTVDRWVAGKSVPHAAQVQALKRLILETGSPSDALAEHLLNPKYRPVIKLLLEEEERGRTLSASQVAEMIEMADRSKGVPTVEMIRIFCGIT